MAPRRESDFEHLEGSEIARARTGCTYHRRKEPTRKWRKRKRRESGELGGMRPAFKTDLARCMRERGGGGRLRVLIHQREDETMTGPWRVLAVRVSARELARHHGILSCRKACDNRNTIGPTHLRQVMLSRQRENYSHNNNARRKRKLLPSSILMPG
eukprot:327850-Hanusia_phi.AAC.2